MNELSIAEKAFLDRQRLNARQIARVFNLPIHLVMYEDDSSQGYFQRVPKYIKAKGRR